MAMIKSIILLNILMIFFVIMTYYFAHAIIFLYQGNINMLSIVSTFAIGIIEAFLILFFITLIYKSKENKHG